MIAAVQIMTGCHSLFERPRTASCAMTGPPPSRSADTATAPVPAEVLGPFHCESLRLDLAEEALDRGQADAAFSILAKALNSEETRKDGFADRALDLLVRILTHPGKDPEKNAPSLTCFTDLAGTRPETIFGPASSCWLTLVNTAVIQHQELQRVKQALRSRNRRIQGLVNQIEQLKAVDLEAVNPEPHGATP